MVANGPSVGMNLLQHIVCPHCWESFPSENVVWISEHQDLLGDNRLGPDAKHRFLPTRFTPDGSALDAKGFPCYSLACPKCHLILPRPLLEMNTLFVSILGTPASGKSFFLGAMTWELRRILPHLFNISFLDADNVCNQTLTLYEESLFLNKNSDQFIPLGDLIEKTQLVGSNLYDSVNYGDQTVEYPRPFLFSFQPGEKHPARMSGKSLSRVLCLYDNAGEHFQPGLDTTASPVTRHMAHSSLLLYLFDPTQDPRFRKLCEASEKGPQLTTTANVTRQEIYLNEAASRVRRYAGLPQNAKHKRPLIVVLTKCDVWDHLLGEPLEEEPWRVSSKGIAGIDRELVENRSQQSRELLLRVTPEIVASAEGFAENVLYVPSSALGKAPQRCEETGKPVIRPEDIKPRWVTVPLLYGLARWSKGLIPIARRKGT